MTIRWPALLLILATGSARADTSIDPLSAGVIGVAQHVHGDQVGGFGLVIETGVRHDAWAYFGECGVTRSLVLSDLGVRRDLREHRDGDIVWAIYVDASAGVAWSATTTRPDLAVGFGWQMRAHDHGRAIGMRSGLRVLVSEDDALPNTATRELGQPRHPHVADGGMLATWELWW